MVFLYQRLCQQLYCTENLYIIKYLQIYCTNSSMQLCPVLIQRMSDIEHLKMLIKKFDQKHATNSHIHASL